MCVLPPTPWRFARPWSPGAKLALASFSEHKNEDCAKILCSYVTALKVSLSRTVFSETLQTESLRSHLNNFYPHPKHG